MSDDPMGMVHACKARRISIPSFVPSFAEYVCASLELPPHSPVTRAVWRAANTYLWLRVSEEQVKANIASEFDGVLGHEPVDGVFVTSFLRELRQRRLEYFSRQWSQLDAVVAVCSSDYRAWRRTHSEQQRRQLQRSDGEEIRLPLITLEQWKSTVVHGARACVCVCVVCVFRYPRPLIWSCQRVIVRLWYWCCLRHSRRCVVKSCLCCIKWRNQRRC